MNIGIIGGGQLGLMMAEAAKDLNHKVISLDPNPKCSIASISDTHIAANYNDETQMDLLYKSSDVLTYEFENVDLNLISKYIDKIPQGTKALEISRNRLLEKNMANRLEVKTVKYHKLVNNDIQFYPCVIKTTTGGYDGKGQYVISSKEEFNKLDIDLSIEYIVEEFVKYNYETSMILTRDTLGNIEYFPAPINNHKNNILFTSLITNDFPINILNKMKEYSERIVKELDYVGTMAIEYFIVGDSVLFNELAPRPHNSGHYTIEGCNVSQFYNHILAITNQVINKPKLIKNTCMLNILGQNISYIINAENLNDVYIHMYGKTDYNTNRKMGHITFLGNTLKEINKTLEEIIKE
ncbi:MAG: N5-carboxyaminoimidazole ribonucleotide synthase [Candidatus Izimaplasma bacterium HR2]|nr:MAG: N5-carboxyaminoimidazole ribonucleotide synthase [Candidatus Izimaplasma bacterium HR2]